MGDGHLSVSGGRWATAELADLLEELGEKLEQLGSGCAVMAEDGDSIDHRTPPLYEVFRLVAASRADGFPRRSGLGEGGPASILDDEGMPMPPKSDPTGELAVADVRSNDPIRLHAQNALRALVDARNLLRKAVSETILAFDETDTELGEPRCRLHEQADLFEETFRGDRCRWCYDFWRAEGEDPDSELIRIRHERGRLNTGDVEQWKKRQNARSQGGRSKRKKSA